MNVWSFTAAGLLATGLVFGVLAAAYKHVLGKQIGGYITHADVCLLAATGHAGARRYRKLTSTAMLGASLGVLAGLVGKVIG